MEDVTALIGKIVLFGGSATAIALGVLKWCGQRWFEKKCAASLEKFKREQSELLELYRYQINARFSRIVKIHEKEFEVLPKIWQLLQDAYNHLMGVANPAQQWPDLNAYTPEQLESFLEKCDLQDFQKVELRGHGDKLAYYRHAAYWLRLQMAQAKFRDFRCYLLQNKIFLSRDLFELFAEIETLMIEVEVELETPEDETHVWRGTIKAYRKLRDDVRGLFDSVESVVQQRLHFGEA